MAMTGGLSCATLSSLKAINKNVPFVLSVYKCLIINNGTDKIIF